MKVLLSHPTGNSNVRAVIEGFDNAGILHEFDTTVAIDNSAQWLKILPRSIRIELLRRSYKLAPDEVWTHPFLEMSRMILTKMKFNNSIKHETGWASIDAVYKNFDRAVASRLPKMLKNNSQLKGIYAYEDGAFHSFKEAVHLNLPRLYDLPIGYWRTARTLLEKEKELWPDWADTLIGLSDSDTKLKRKDEELQLASRIFVASKFTAKTLADYPGKLAPVDVIPYGFPPVSATREYKAISKNRPLKMLFVGGLSQRKGIANLFKVAENLKKYVELTVVGRKGSINCPALNEALSKHRWIDSLSHAEILNLMKEYDVFVFPSLFEGFGLVITEAMSQGTPVITTDRTAGPDLISHGHNGWLTEAGSTEALQAAVEDILNRPQIIEMAGRAAMETARQRPWSQYGHELAEAVKKAL